MPDVFRIQKILQERRCIPATILYGSEWQHCPEAEMLLVDEAWIFSIDKLFYTMATVFGILL